MCINHRKHLIAHAQDCAEHLGATLEAVELADFIANAPSYLAKNPHVIALLESSDLGVLLGSAYQHHFKVGLVSNKIMLLSRLGQPLNAAR
jgi:hypothetical protein